MCGIIGYLGGENAAEKVMKGLQTLEYRGYDSSGVGFAEIKSGEKPEIKIIKSVGHVAELIKKVDASNVPDVRLAIGHTRWATHGGVSETNSHPHASNCGRVVVVHNGIVENYRELRADLESEGIAFKSDTDTEVIPNLIAKNLKNEKDFLCAVRKATKLLVGSFAFLAISTEFPDTIIAAKNGSQPLVIGRQIQTGNVFISSDTPTAIAQADDIYALEDKEFAVITRGKIKFFLDDKPHQKHLIKLTSKPKEAKKDGYSTFMEKEINEIPNVILDIQNEYANRDMTELYKRISTCNTVHISACGTSYHAGLYIAQMLEAKGKRARTYIASELDHITPFIEKNDIAIVISQSGETIDTLFAMKTFKACGLFTIAICNVEGSSIWRYADEALPTVAGTEVAVASTKAFVAQSLVGEILCNWKDFKQTFTEYSAIAKDIIAKQSEIKELTKKHIDASKIFFLGKGVTSVVALESALKIKEITYRHCEGFPAGELKHGPLSLVDDKTLTIALTPVEEAASAKMLNSCHEVVARGSKLWTVPATESILSIIYAQLFALYMCQESGLDPDKPRNLAKSVTVD